MRPELERAVAELKSGDPDALERALALLQQTVFSFSMKVCGHREDAEDTAQETLFRTAPELAKFDSAQALAVWLYKVARSRCLMSRRRSKFAPRQHISLDEVLPDRSELASLLKSGEPGPDQHLLRKENAAVLRQAILRIPPDYRQILVLHDMEELSTREVAQITGLREGTVRVRLHRARAFLRNELAGRPRARRRGPKSTRSRSCKQLFAALSDYLDREIDPASRERVEAHLGDCAPCKAYFASLQETVRRCRSHCTEPMKSNIAAELCQMVQESISAQA